jgi:hypothetical protein
MLLQWLYALIVRSIASTAALATSIAVVVCADVLYGSAAAAHAIADTVTSAADTVATAATTADTLPSLLLLLPYCCCCYCYS